MKIKYKETTGLLNKMVKKYCLKDFTEHNLKKNEVYISKDDVMKMYNQIMKDEFITGFTYYLQEVKN